MTNIFHITHIDNLQGMINAGGLHCDRVTSERGLCLRNIGYAHIKERRARREVTVSMQGTLWDYVPFYFCPRSVMLYVNSKGRVPGYADGQTPIVHLVTSAEKILASGLPFLFTDGHAEVQFSIQYDDLANMNQLDWEVINANIWRDIDEDFDRKRRKQSEFLVYQFVPWIMIDEIGVINQDIYTQVVGIIRGSDHQPVVTIQPEWYY